MKLNSQILCTSIGHLLKYNHVSFLFFSFKFSKTFGFNKLMLVTIENTLPMVMTLWKVSVYFFE